MQFDSNILILFISNTLNEELVDLLKLEIIKGNAYISRIVLIEVTAFSEYDDNRVKEIESFILKYFKIIDINSNIARLSAKLIRYKKIKTGKKFKLTDAIIAATSIAKDQLLLTLDKEDFKDIEDLKLFKNKL